MIVINKKGNWRVVFKNTEHQKLWICLQERVGSPTQKHLFNKTWLPKIDTTAYTWKVRDRMYLEYKLVQYMDVEHIIHMCMNILREHRIHDLRNTVDNEIEQLLFDKVVIPEDTYDYPPPPSPAPPKNTWRGGPR